MFIIPIMIGKTSQDTSSVNIKQAPAQITKNRPRSVKLHLSWSFVKQLGTSSIAGNGCEVYLCMLFVLISKSGPFSEESGTKRR